MNELISKNEELELEIDDSHNVFGLLSAASKYKSTGKSSPVENYITECFAWILNHNPQFAIFFLENIGELKTVKWFNSQGEDAQKPLRFNTGQGSFQTQVKSSGGGFYDMVFQDENSMMVFEHKVWDAYHKSCDDPEQEQYKRYEKSLQETLGVEDGLNRVGTVVGIVGDFLYKPHVKNAHCAWRNIYEWISKYLGNDPDVENTQDFILKNFQNLLLEKGLGPMTAINFQEINDHSQRVIELENKKPDFEELKTFFKNFHGRYFGENIEDNFKFKKDVELWQGGTQTTAEFIQEISRVNGQWGRVGIELDGRYGVYWRPGLTVSIYYDSYDYKVPLLEGEGADLMIDLCAQQGKEGVPYKGNNYYNDFVMYLKKQEGIKELGWSIYDVYQDNVTEHTVNDWHPLLIRKKCAEVFEKAKGGEDQSKKLYEEIKPVLDTILSSEEFYNLRKIYKTSE